MLIGILSDSHDELLRVQRAVGLLREAGAEALIHCGDLSSPPILAACASLPCAFVFGNHDADHVPVLRAAAQQCGAICLDWGGMVEWGGKRLGVAHGHMTGDLRRVLAQNPDYLFSGHSHLTHDEQQGTVRRINPGALFRADQFTVATLELESGVLQFLTVTD